MSSAKKILLKFFAQYLPGFKISSYICQIERQEAVVFRSQPNKVISVIRGYVGGSTRRGRGCATWRGFCWIWEWGYSGDFLSNSREIHT